MGDAPLTDAGVLGQHVPQAGLQHAFRRLFQDARVGDDGLRAGVVKGHLDPLADHGGVVRGIAIHGRGGCHHQAGKAHRVGEDLGQVIEHAGAQGQHAITGRVKRHHQGAQGLLVRLQVRILKNIGAKRNRRFLEHRLHQVPGGLAGVGVHDDEGARHLAILQKTRQGIQRALPDAQALQPRLVVAPTGAVVAFRADQFRKGHLCECFHGQLPYRLFCWQTRPTPTVCQF